MAPKIANFILNESVALHVPHIQRTVQPVTFRKVHVNNVPINATPAPFPPFSASPPPFRDFPRALARGSEQDKMKPELVPSSPNDVEDDEGEGQNEEEEAGGGGGGGGGKGRWSVVGSAMLGLGAKAAIAGATLTSAPVVVPPLFLFSALGLAFSVPFGIFFAGVACTDKLMQTLLPPPSPRYQEQEEEEEDVFAEERERKEVLEEEEEEEKEVGGEKEEKEVEVEPEGIEVELKEKVKEEQREVEEKKREEEGRSVAENKEEKEVDEGEEEVTRWEGEGGRVIESEEQSMSAPSFQVVIEPSRLISEHASACPAEHGSEAKAGAAVDQPSDDFCKVSCHLLKGMQCILMQDHNVNLGAGIAYLSDKLMKEL